MTKPIIRIHNLESDEIIDREMTDSEYEIYQKKIAQYETDQAAEVARIAAEAEAKAAEEAAKQQAFNDAVTAAVATALAAQQTPASTSEPTP